MKKTPAVVLTSAGLDSTTTLALALQQHDPVYAVWAEYGSTHNKFERLKLPEILDWFALAGGNLELFEVSLPDIFKHKSALMGDVPMTDEVAPTIVPFRNANLISVATTIAVTRGASHVWFGAHAEDALNWAYPDCTPEFLGAMGNAMFVGTQPNPVRLVYPLLWMLKKDVVELAYKLGVPAHLTHTCYTPVTQDANIFACGRCPSCIERVNAFKAAKLIDPIAYAVQIDWDGCDAYVIAG